jgi:hypothetical protein
MPVHRRHRRPGHGREGRQQPARPRQPPALLGRSLCQWARLLRDSLALQLTGLPPQLPGLAPPSRSSQPAAAAAAQPKLPRRRAGAAGRGRGAATKCEALRLRKKTQCLTVSRHHLALISPASHQYLTNNISPLLLLS